MDFQVIQETAMSVCGWDTAPTYLFSKNVFSNLIYYSHLFPLILSISFAIVLSRLRIGSIFTQRAFYWLTALFSIWVLLDLVTWATEKIDVVMFAWSVLILADIGVYYVATLIAQAQILRRKPTNLTMILLSLPMLPVLVLLSTEYNLVAFDLTNCEREAIEGPLWTYVYAVELLYVLYIVSLLFFNRTVDKTSANSRRYFVGGIVTFLVLFSLGNITGSITLDWSIAQYGIFGMPIMLGFLIYQAGTDVQQTNKLLVIRLLSVTLLVLVGSLIFISDIVLTHYILAITLIPLSIAFLFLERSVRSEIDHRKRIVEMANDLRHINDQQSNLMHFITHQIKGFFTKSKNIASMVLEGDFGKYDPEIQKMLKMSIENDDRGVALVQELLNATNLKRGTVQYNMVNVDMREVVKEAVDMVELSAKAKGLMYGKTVPAEPVMVRCDASFIKQSLRNVVDNAVKYTPIGEVKILLTIEKGFAVVRVHDTGVGFTSEDRVKLFTEGGRGSQSAKMNVESTGYGLYIVKNVIEQHGGHVDAVSEGPGKGSVFTLALPIQQ
jgi:signal transduction histidine kinase